MEPTSELLTRGARVGAVAPEGRAALARWLLGDPTQTGFLGVAAANAEDVVAERLRWLPAACAALDGPLDVAGYEERIPCGPEQVFRFHLPLAQGLLARVARGAGRELVAVAGLPAGGKSVFTALMLRVLRALAPPFGVVAIGLDGYHYANAYLLAHRTPPWVAEQGPLRLYKGAHFTFDVLRLASDLRRLRDATGPVLLPAYDRRLHDPVEGRIAVTPADRLVLVEGNYLLHRRDGWERLRGLFDLGIFLDLPPGTNREPMIARHMRGGRSRDDAVRHFERVDRLNTELIAATRAEADVVVELGEAYEVRAIRRGVGASGQ